VQAQRKRAWPSVSLIAAENVSAFEVQRETKTVSLSVLTMMKQKAMKRENPSWFSNL
jgi:hypothetical protein